MTPPKEKNCGKKEKVNFTDNDYFNPKSSFIKPIT
tara:strand:- start:1 stop:105 length:105 start_codon:yes stop_codon:yes gene_type:complete